MGGNRYKMVRLSNGRMVELSNSNAVNSKRIEKFEDLNAWKEARILYKEIISMTRLSIVKKDYVFIDQIRRAALSIMSNIAEGFESLTDKEKVNFLNFARRSCAEVRSQLYTALDNEYIDKNGFTNLYEKAIKTGKLITGLMNYLRR